MKMTPGQLRKFSKERFEKQYPVLSLWQELSEHFYPQRSDFLRTHTIGAELTDSLASSQPLLIQRELANSLEAMLRDGVWFEIGIEGEPDHEGRMWLDWASKRLLMLINQRTANFRRATKELDNDYVTFGNGVMSIELNRLANGLLFRTWHMRDCAWWDDENGQVDGVLIVLGAPKIELDRAIYEPGDVPGMADRFAADDMEHDVDPRGRDRRGMLVDAGEAGTGGDD